MRKGGVKLNKPLPMWRSLVLASLLFAGTWFLSGCEERKENKAQLSFQIVMPQGWNVINQNLEGRVDRLDTDGDGEIEWVVFYAFDQPGPEAFTPIRAAIYDIARREPKLPVIYPYHLQAPGWTYLGEGSDENAITAYVDDVVTVTELGSTYPDYTDVAEKEVIVRGYAGKQRVAIFQWRDNRPPDLRDRMDPSEVLLIPNSVLRPTGQWYECLGMFEGSLRVEVVKDRVTVWNRTGDRSQFAAVYTYVPTNGPGGYLDGNDNLIAPSASCIEFPFGVPSDVAQSPYPEKAVMAYLKTFMQEPDYGANWLTDNAQNKQEAEASLAMFVPEKAPIVSGVCIKEVSYVPSQETEAEAWSYAVAEEQGITSSDLTKEPLLRIQSTQQATPTVVPITAQVETVAQYPTDAGDEQVRIVWQLNHVGNEWKIDNITVTKP
jgi:hypothetical protein